MTKQSENIEEPGVGHNSLSPKDLLNIIQRVESLMEEKKSLGDDIKNIFNEAESKGFDKATIKQVIKIRAMDQEKRIEKAELLDMYLHAIGLL